MKKIEKLINTHIIYYRYSYCIKFQKLKRNLHALSKFTQFRGIAIATVKIRLNSPIRGLN